MKNVGFGVKYEVGNRTETVIFDESHDCVSLKDKAVSAEYRGISWKILPGEIINCPIQFIEWALNDPMSPFLRDGSFVVSVNDAPIDVAAAKVERDKKFAAEKAEKMLPNGFPDDKWKPKQLMDLYRSLDPKEIDERGFIVMTPPGKARRLREYMMKNHITLKDGAVIREASAA
ncbi:MAG: hypothetical protein A2Y38_19240 [Spirochaetes bacterium GWB1_59_5]|nr:MAG: hypothetical protein A2Y38_19240 [Spirochaetes bacterium GWB1_59_5]